MSEDGETVRHEVVVDALQERFTDGSIPYTSPEQGDERLATCVCQVVPEEQSVRVELSAGMLAVYVNLT